MTRTDQIDYTDPLLGINKHFENISIQPEMERNEEYVDDAKEPVESNTTVNTLSNKLAVINTARSIIRGEQTLTRKQLVELIENLEKFDQFSYATEVLLVRMKLDESRGQTITLKDYETLAKYIYKDHSLPSSFKFKKALQELTSREDLAATDKCETLGIAGQIYKRKWQFDHRFKNLVLSKYYYKRGFEKWKEFIEVYNNQSKDDDKNDRGYNAINYAYISELMAVEKLVEQGKITGLTEGILSQLAEARETRLFILKQFVVESRNGEPELINSKAQKWEIATIAEAYFGLSKYEHALKFIYDYVNRKDVTNSEIRTLGQQLSSLAYLQDFILKYRTGYKSATLALTQRLDEIAGKINIRDINRCLQLVEDKSHAAGDVLTAKQIKQDGKAGLALSGGGLRAALFHIGTLAALAEKDELKNIELISCVSGGSIIGTYYYLKLKALLERKPDHAIIREDYVQIVKEIEKEFLSATQRNLRMRIFSNLISNLRMLKKDYSRSHRLGELYEEQLYRKLISIVRSEDEVQQGKKDNEIYMSDLFIRPKDAPADFVLATDNWKRSNKVPQLVLNATSVNTGHNWQFTASWMGEPPGNIQTDIDVKPRLRRMYYSEAPGPYKNFRLGYAVAASSCVPVLFHPMPLPDLYPDIDLELIDGGVHDNQGVSALLEQECSKIIISDGSGQMETNSVKTKNYAALFFRSDTILQERLRELQFVDIKQRNDTTQIDELLTVHLKSDLESRPVSWKFCTDPPRTIMYGNVANNDNDLTKYGILRNVQLYLSEIRTDLDSFSDAEAYALMYSGYAQVRYEYGRQVEERDYDNELTENNEQWEFLKIKPYLTRPDKAAEKEKLFKEANRVPFKLYHLSDNLRKVVLGLGLVALTALLAIAFVKRNESFAFNIQVKTIAITAMLFVAGIFYKVLGSFLNYKSTVRKWIGFVSVAVVGWIVSNVYLALLNNVYNDFGKLEEDKK